MQRRVFTKETGRIGLLKCVAGDETLEKRKKRKKGLLFIAMALAL